MITRRAVLLGGLAGVGLLGVGFAGVVEDVLPGGPAVRRRLGWTGQDGTTPDVPPAPVTGRTFTSAARGREVRVNTVVPAGADPGALPVCVALHGRGGDAHEMVYDLGLPQFLTAAVRAGVPPFALVAVDGGDSYWIRRQPGDDPLAMLRDELPGWLAQVGLRPQQAVLGTSMGGFGGLALANAMPLKAAALCSPALFPTWDDARTIDGFADRASWAAADPFQHPVPEDLALGVWCGLEDPFLEPSRELVRRHPARIASLGEHGAHSSGYWQRVFPEVFRFLGTTLSGSAS